MQIERRESRGLTGLPFEVAAFANVAFGPIFACAVVAAWPTVPWVSEHQMQLAAIPVLVIVMLLRAHRAIGLAVNVGLGLIALVGLAFSAQPLAYLTYSLYIALVAAVGLAIILFINHKRRVSDKN